jgi:hypothetical protein
MADLISKKHYKRKYEGFENARPCKRSKRDVNERGYQYIAKQDDCVVLYSRGFSAEDIAALHEASQKYVESLKRSGEDAVWKSIDPSMAFDDILNKARYAYYMWLDENDVDITPQFKTRVHNILRKWPAATPEFKYWHSAHI